jgi:hypothetical protein
MSEPEQQRRRRGSCPVVKWLEADDIEVTHLRGVSLIKPGIWLHVNPRSASTRCLTKNLLTGFTEGDAAYGPVQVQELNHKANGVELVFYINSDPGKVSRVWWMRVGGNPLKFRFADNAEMQRAGATKSTRMARAETRQQSTIPGGRRSGPEDSNATWSTLAFNAGNRSKQERAAWRAADQEGEEQSAVEQDVGQSAVEQDDGQSSDGSNGWSSTDHEDDGEQMTVRTRATRPAVPESAEAWQQVYADIESFLLAATDGSYPYIPITNWTAGGRGRGLELNFGYPIYTSKIDRRIKFMHGRMHGSV